MLAKHYGDIPAAARELDVPIPDLRRLTWAKPDLLEEAELERMEVIARAWGQLIEALYSDDPRRQMWACGQDHVELAGARSSACARQARARRWRIAAHRLSLGRRRSCGGRARARWADPCGPTVWRAGYAAGRAHAFAAVFTQVAGTGCASTIGGEPIPTLVPPSTEGAVAAVG